MRTNTKVKFTETTHEGAPAARMNAVQALRRSVCACLLWEDEFYEDGQEIAKRIEKLVSEVPAHEVWALTLEARTIMNLRHVPLFLLSCLAKIHRLDKTLVASVIQRADELSELLAIHAKLNGVTPDKVKKTIPAQMKQGLAFAFGKFDEYQLGKYDRAGAIRLRDVLFLCHAKPRDVVQADLWKRLVENKLAVPDTWEVGLSTGGDKKETFTRLLQEKKLGYLALLRNLRNMVQADVDCGLVREAILARKGGAERVLPFRFIAAAKAAPRFEPELDLALVANCQAAKKLSGKTVVVIDISGSMTAQLSSKSDMTRKLAACALGAIARELCQEPVVYATAGNDGLRTHATAEVPARRGMALVDAIAGMNDKLGGGGIYLTQSMDFIRKRESDAVRTIVITDEQDCSGGGKDSPLNAVPLGAGYMINVASAKNGIGYKPYWTHIDGWSEGVFAYMHAMESVDSVS